MHTFTFSYSAILIWKRGCLILLTVACLERLAHARSS